MFVNVFHCVTHLSSVRHLFVYGEANPESHLLLHPLSVFSSPHQLAADTMSQNCRSAVLYSLVQEAEESYPTSKKDCCSVVVDKRQWIHVKTISLNMKEAVRRIYNVFCLSSLQTMLHFCVSLCR